MLGTISAFAFRHRETKVGSRLGIFFQKGWYSCARLHGVITQKTAMQSFAAVKT